VKLKLWAPVCVEWSDAHGGDDGWQPFDPSHIATPVPITSVGLLAAQNRQGVTLVMSRNGITNDIASYLFVPRVNIVSIRELR